MTDDHDPASRPIPAPRPAPPSQPNALSRPNGPVRPNPAARLAPPTAGAAARAPGDSWRDRGSARRADPAAAGRRLAQQIAASRSARRQRIVLAVVGAMSAITLLLSGGAWVVTSYISSRLGRVDAGTSGTPSSGPINLLVAGIDTRGGLTRAQELRLHVGSAISSNSDTLMLVHIPAGHQSIQVVSLPRDSWVDIPGHGMSKINAAYGDGGPQLMVRTVEQATGLTINDYIEVDFLGFVKVIDALGGVNICVPFAVNDHYSGLHLSAGRHHVSGITALSFARDRHSFATSDLARIGDQQQLLSSLFTEATQTGVLADPVRLEHFLSSVTSVVKVDSGFNLIRLADEMRGLRPANVSFTTVPIATASYITSTGQDAVLWDAKAASALFGWLKKDAGTARPARSRSRPGSAHGAAGITRAQVSVDVYNGTLIGGLSVTTGAQLTTAGFSVHKAGLNWPAHDVARTVIEYSSGQAVAARLLAKAMPGAALRVVAGLTRIRLVLGVSGHTVSAATSGGQHAPAANGPPGAPGQSRTAAQAACR
jgi:LCP family protein required for cell wall assembly